MEAVAFMKVWGGLISAGLSAVSAISSANQQKAASKYNQQVAENQAIAARQQAGANAEMQRRSSEKKIGSMQASYAASGVSIEGSALDILEESARNAEMDRQNIIYGGELRAIGSEGTAMLEKSQGERADFWLSECRWFFVQSRRFILCFVRRKRKWRKWWRGWRRWFEIWRW